MRRQDDVLQTLQRGHEALLIGAGLDGEYVDGRTAQFALAQCIGAEVARKLIDYSDSGSTMGAVNFPQVQLPARPSGTRFIQVQRNVPGMLGRLNEVLARHAVNIAAQYYETNNDIGYVVLDADASAADSERVLADIRALEGTIRARLLYEYKD